MTRKTPYDPTTQPYDEPLRHVDSHTRFINCEVCQTEGRILRSNGGPDDIDYGVCPACNGKCEIEVECEPVTEYDLENAEWY